MLLLCALVAGAAAAEGSVPALPQEFWGSVTIDGSAAPAGTVIVAMIDDNEAGSMTTTESGMYGSSSRYEENRLAVVGTDEQRNETITFLVNGQDAAETATFTPGGTVRLDLSAGSAVTPTPTSTSSGGSSSGGSSGGSSSSITTATATPTVHTGQASLTSSKAGEVRESVTVRNADGSGSLTVPEGTTALDGNGDPLDEVSIQTLDPAILPLVPAGNTFALALNCGPDGATFDPAVSLAFTLTGDEWAGIPDPDTLTVFWYDDDTGTWQEVQATVDTATHTVTAQISHFSTYTLTYSSVQTGVTAAAGEEVATTATTSPAGTTQTGAGSYPWPLIGAACLILVLAVAGAYVWKKRG